VHISEKAIIYKLWPYSGRLHPYSGRGQI